ncbi:UDP-2,4-diacetamido-2,4,6-trideoxy-beta-L-altropyranose hydrolase [Pseudomonas neustonica]|uniref:UDP-2,4-diacetamido-2,4, 6-trideoxy-beta-L-altropyranose hydrolase n=1 Tax=Pseudomonas neustonica TaxID=2487346 RepID=A0ABX9XQ76_9PSED|nr:MULTISPECIES: UDP-2,4-diacetamido-2,4,6-trideoxy-beta-L-altropyranose hydrolase [Pseudomonas]MBA6420462.1 UDP-2,4-diacetamido-2,4,6-trideoxy-beta-L-altropyranose hydrolase [Pseudomonas sp. 5Ae-yellow]ROZ87211.1 UDP-2,4-diacetamido-2,4,6-trideoxy-beta-L-altropyranose hydrolase [Pseudomonas sp. SSM44]ROZ88172.1 UDP-2,4-diacetamido-2,4,6-trideoxy-beta-L-altropyranose hydrolase [Pseudomonas neustonica]|tara:strand:- start:1426 stop:2541 length:1116 start_codon:yes stop_codon:yes gene_type:complete
MTSKQVVFRADASLDMGTGHVMRCLTLANALREKGYECHFICREHKGNLIDFILGQGFHAHPLVCSPTTASNGWEHEGEELAHAAWLGASQRDDAGACQKVLEKIKPQWLVVDHYALDCQWEQALKPYYERLMVIDDLADRSHQCELLLDQNLGRMEKDYNGLVSEKCNRLIGPNYALLRPEFVELRERSLERRHNSKISRILITLGGVDLNNVTAQVLEALGHSQLPLETELDIVMGASAPSLLAVRRQAKELPFKATVSVNVRDMAERMCLADLCIGAAGSTSWERCCLGLPAIQFVLADNQKMVNQSLIEKGAAIALDTRNVQASDDKVLEDVLTQIWSNISRMINSSAAIVDGLGSKRVVDHLMSMK